MARTRTFLVCSSALAYLVDEALNNTKFGLVQALQLKADSQLHDLALHRLDDHLYRHYWLQWRMRDDMKKTMERRLPASISLTNQGDTNLNAHSKQRIQ